MVKTYPFNQQGDPYRLGVGLVVFNQASEVLVGERHDAPGAWQFPQGGIDAGEDPWVAAQRELTEETGLLGMQVSLLGEYPDWLQYDFPPHMGNHPIYGRFRGQRQKWFAVKLNDSVLPHAPTVPDAHSVIEFMHFKFVPLKDTPKRIVGFKRPLYEMLVNNFMRFAK